MLQKLQKLWRIIFLQFQLSLVKRNHPAADWKFGHPKRSFTSYIRASSAKLWRTVKLWRPYSWLSNYTDTQTWCIPPPAPSSLAVLQNLSVTCPSYIYLSSSFPLIVFLPAFLSFRLPPSLPQSLLMKILFILLFINGLEAINEWYTISHLLFVWIY